MWPINPHIKSSQLTVAFFAFFVHVASAAISSVVTGVPVGFGSATTDDGTVTAVHPMTIADLRTYLTSSSPQVIVNFAGSEGNQSLTACNAPRTLSPSTQLGIEVASDKTLVGTNGATLNGKGLRLVNNIKIENLNPQYVWGGDAISLFGTSNVWIDHRHLRRPLVLGLELVDGGDFITFYRNGVCFTSGRSPALSGTTLFHAVNNVWSSNSGHLIEGTENDMGLYEGNYSLDTPTIVTSGSVVALHSSEAADLTQCQASLGRSCVANLLGTGAASSVNYDTTSFLTNPRPTLTR
ncbi:pectin lyase E [Mycena olivaceomarginata]|nr:pectin lyase E [Mycena olivaceomarginata]